MSPWRVLVENELSTQGQMARDAALAEEASPTVRFFTWTPPAVSLGWKQRAPEWLSCADGVEVVERPTGGGAAFHGSDVSVAVIVPRTLALPLEVLMRAVCHSAARLCHWCGAEVTCVLEAHAEGRITYCLSQPSPYAVLSGSRKLAGFSLRRYSNSWLIQGSLLVRPIPAQLVRNIPDAVGHQLRTRAISLSEATHTVLDERTVAVQWAQHWSSWWHSDFTDFNPVIGPRLSAVGRMVQQEHAGGRDVAPIGAGLRVPRALPVGLHMMTPIPVMTDSCRGESTPSSTISV